MAEKAEKTAVQRLGYFQGQVKVAESKLADLERFRWITPQQWIVRGSTGVTGQWLMGFQGFLANSKPPLTSSARAWPGTRTISIRPARAGNRRLPGSKACANWCSAIAKKRSALEDKREQKLLDELSQRLPRHESVLNHSNHCGASLLAKR